MASTSRAFRDGPFRDCCRSLTSDKVMERRKQMLELKVFLTNAGVVEYLNANSDRKQGYTWDRLFESVKGCLHLEVESLEKDLKKTSLSTIMLSNIDRKKKECIGLMKLVVAKANACLPRLKTTLLTTHLLLVIQNDFMREHFLMDYNTILDKHILSNQAVMREVSSAVSNELIVIYVNLYRDLKPGSNFGQVLRILDGLIKMSASQVSLDTKLLFTFYRDAIRQSRTHKFNGSLHVSLLSASYSFCALVATDCRRQVCHLGEEVAGELLFLLGDSCTKPLKGIIVRFFALQMMCHHPGGATTEDKGMVVIDSVSWKLSLHRLYDILAKDLTPLSTKGRFQDLVLAPDFLDLLVNVSHQEFANRDGGGGDGGCAASKRQRLSRGLGALIDQLQCSVGHTEVPTMWLQFLSALLRRYPTSVATRDEFFRIVQLLYNLQVECKQSGVMTHILDCIGSTLSAYCHSVTRKADNVDPLLSYWRKIYDAAVRTVTVNQCEAEAHAVIRGLIVGGIVNPGSELQVLFVRGLGAGPSRHAILTLAVVLRHGDLLKFLEHRTYLRPPLASDPAVAFRVGLLDWLLPDATKESTDHRTLFDRLTVETMGEILAVLALRNCSVIDVQLLDFVGTTITDLETGYLRSTFSETIVSLAKPVQEQSDEKHFVLPTVRDKILELFHRDCATLLDAPAQGDSVATISFECCLVTKFLGSAIRHCVLSIDDLVRGRMCDILQNLMLKLARDVQVLHESENSPLKLKMLLIVVTWLHHMCWWEGSLDYCKTMTQFCREMVSETLVTVLVELIYNKPAAVSGDQVDGSDSDPDFDEGIPVDDAVIPTENAAGETASELTDLRAKAVATLSCLCRHSRVPLLSPLRPPAAGRATAESPHSVQSRLLMPITNPTFKPDSIEHLPLVFTILSELTEPFQQLSNQHMEMMLDVLRVLCRTFFKDVERSNSLLGVLARLLPKLETADTDVRSRAIRLVEGFWDCRVKGKSSPLLDSGIAGVVVALTKCDPVVFACGSGAAAVHEVLSPALLLQFLRSLSHPYAVSSYAAENITALVRRWDPNIKTATLAPMREQEKLLRLVQDVIEDSAVEGDGYLAKMDLQFNWTATSLIALTHIAIAGCVKPALFALVKHGHEVPASRTIVRKAIERIASASKHRSTDKFVEAHMGYLLQQCLKKGFGLGNYLWELFEPRTKFVRHYYPIIVLHVFDTKDADMRNLICEIMERPWQELVEECYPQIMTLVLPGFAMLDDNSVDASVKRLASECHEQLEELLTPAVVNGLLLANLDRVVVSLLKCLYESGTADNIDELPTPNPPFYSKPIIQASLRYITQACNDPNKSLVALICKTRDAGQNILIALHTNLQESVEDYEIYMALSMYSIFVGLLLEQFETGLGGSWAFVLQDVIYTLSHQITRLRLLGLKLVTTKACVLLHQAVIAGVEGAISELAKLLITIVDCLVPVAGAGNDNQEGAEQALLTLNYLVLEHGNNLKVDLAIVEPFPDTDAFSAIRSKHLSLKFTSENPSLREEMEYFLKRVEHLQVLHRTDGLKRLHQVLASHKDELVGLVEEKSESDQLLYRVVTTLFHICESCMSKSDIVLHSAMCLGEIGPVTFPTLVLRRPHSVITKSLEAFDRDTSSQRLLIVFHLLHTFVIGSDVTVKGIASQVLKRILATKSGHEFAVVYRSKKVGHLFQYLHPFLTDEKIPVQQNLVEPSGILDHLDSPENLQFEAWLKHVVTKLIDARVSGCEVTQLLAPICEVQVKFCEELLPLLIHAVLISDTNKHASRAVLSKWIDSFFTKFCGHLDSGEISPPSSQSSATTATVPIFIDKRAIRVMLSVVQHVRLQDRAPVRGKALTAWENNFWLDINYLNVAKAADHCRAHFTALMFVEIWCDKTSSEHETDDSDGSGPPSDLLTNHCFHKNASKLDRLLHCGAVGTNEVQDLLLQIHQHIGDPDAVHGCQILRLSDQTVRLNHYVREGHWDRALGAGDLAMQTGTLVSPDGLLYSMHKMGLNHLSQLFFDNLVEGSNWSADQLDSIREHQNLCAWKMSRWLVPATGGARDTSLLFNGCIHQSLLSLREGDNQRFDRLCRQAHELVIDDLNHASLESMSSLRQPATNLALLNKLIDGKCLSDRANHEFLLKKWSSEGAMLRDMNVEAELINSLRCSVLDSSGDRESLRRPLLRCIVQQVRLSRAAGLLQWAEMYVARVATVSDVPLEQKMLFKLEEAKTFWSRTECEAAVGLLGSTIREMERSEGLVKSKLYGRALGTYGGWLIETRTENATVVLDGFLEKSISILEKFSDSDGDEHDDDCDDTLLNAYLSTARYADAQYQRVHDYIESSVYKLKQEMIIQSVKACDKLTQEPVQTTDVRRTLINLRAQIKIDRSEVEAVLENRRMFLAKAVQGYINCLLHGDKHNMRVFRLVSLWFANTEHQPVNDLMGECIRAVQSRKFLPLIYQLAARMDSTMPRPPFQVTLLQLIERVTVDHPFHTLSIIFALSNSTQDAVFAKQSKRAPKKEQESRVVASRCLLGTLSVGRLGPIIRTMTRLCDALIEFSYWQPGSQLQQGVKHIIPGDKHLVKLSSLDQVPPLTMNVPVDPSCGYQNVPHIHQYKKYFNFCGGVNAPKKVSCVSSDGREHHQLVKGNDDLRQDNVMQQVFTIVNGLLKSNPETSLRQLSVGTYKVVPLSQLSGVLEWCRNTEPIGSYLIGGPGMEGAHRRYNPKDWAPSNCKTKMKSIAGGTPAEKLDVYLNVCNRLNPVFHHFFLENFPEPPVWYERRVAYIKSVATSSIVGYILGLGDRHVSNILINKQTAEFIHIDFGIAFEQGKNLPTPETVPFRLTRDVVDGMGVMGTDGIFTRCCEKTLELMRDSQEVILTILGVFLYDPLYQWTLSPIKCRKLQGQADRMVTDTNTSVGGDGEMWFAMESEQISETDANINKLAERALVRLQDKLQGKEDGTVLSVSGQVSHLIQQAVDPRNLCRLYFGWQAYL